MAQNLTLAWNQKAPLSVGLLYDDGTVADLGKNWSSTFDPAGVARIVGSVGSYFIEGLKAGTTTLTIIDADATTNFSEVIEVTVTGPLAVGLAVSIGPAEPKV